MLENRPAGYGLPTFADLARDVEGHQLTVTRLGPEYYITQSELRHWQLARLCDHLRERYPKRRRDREAS
jgi:hypothetical protein